MCLQPSPHAGSSLELSSVRTTQSDVYGSPKTGRGQEHNMSDSGTRNEAQVTSRRGVLPRAL